MSFKRKFYKNVATIVGYNYSSQILEFLSTIILSRLILPAEYGFFAIINIFAGFVKLFADAGITDSIIRSDYQYTYYKLLFSLSIWLGAALMILLSALAYPISILMEDERLFFPIIVVALNFLIDSINYVPSGIMAKNLEFNTTGKAKFVGAIIQISLSIILAFAGFSYWALILPLLISPIGQYIVLRRKVKMKIVVYNWRFTKFTLLKIKGLMGNITLHNTVNYWANNADKLIIGKFFTDSDLGLYNRAYRFLMMANRLLNRIFGSVLFPSLKKLKDENGNVNKEYSDIIDTLALANLPLVIILMAFPHTLVNILWGENWLTVADYLPYIGVIIAFQSIINTTTRVFILKHREKMMSLTTLVASVITITSVIIGALYSVRTILQFYTISYVLIIIPIYIYWGFHKAFNFSILHNIHFWGPKLLAGIGMLLSIELDNIWIFMATMSFYLMHLVYRQINSINGIIQFWKKKLRKKSS